jgi:hypothetical protein
LSFDFFLAYIFYTYTFNLGAYEYLVIAFDF